MPKEVKIIITGVRRNEPDLERLTRALLLDVLAQRQAQAEEGIDPPAGPEPMEATS